MEDLPLKCDFVFEEKRFVPPVYTVWKRSWLGKWSVIERTESLERLIEFSNKPVVIRSTMGMLMGNEDLLDKFKKSTEQPLEGER